MSKAPGLGADRRVPWRLVAVAAVAVVGVGWWLSAAFGDEGEVQLADVVVTDLVLGVDVEGTLVSRDSTILTPPQIDGFWDFQIRFMAPEGSAVSAGQPVLAFDTSTLEQRLLQLETEAEQATKNIEKLDVDLQQRLGELELQLAEAEARARRAELQADVPLDLQSAKDAEVAGLDVELTNLEVDSLREQLEAARSAGASQRAALVAQRDRAERLVVATRDAIERLTVTAPRAGTVIYVTDRRGEKNSVGDTVWRREKIIELPDLSSMMAQGEVDESDAGRIREGQGVTLRLDAHPDITYEASIESIWKTVQRKSFSRNPIKVVRVDLALSENDQTRMRPGMRFRGTIESKRIEGATAVPVRAVQPTADGPVVYRKSVLGFDRVEVALGERNSEYVQILDGLEPGDRVALGDPMG